MTFSFYKHVIEIRVETEEKFHSKDIQTTEYKILYCECDDELI